MSEEQDRFSRYSSIEFRTNQVVEGFITGLHKSPFHGFSVEFAEHRLYNTGESTRLPLQRAAAICCVPTYPGRILPAGSGRT